MNGGHRSSPHDENVAAVYRAADALIERAVRLEDGARKAREEAARLTRLASAWADGRPLEEEL